MDGDGDYTGGFNQGVSLLIEDEGRNVFAVKRIDSCRFGAVQKGRLGVSTLVDV